MMIEARFNADPAYASEWELGPENQTVYGYLLEEDRLWRKLEIHSGTSEMRNVNRELLELEQTYPGLHEEAQKVRLIINLVRVAAKEAA